LICFRFFERRKKNVNVYYYRNSLGLLSFQTAIALHESNGIDIIIALVLNDINPLGKQRMDLVLELKVCGSIA